LELVARTHARTHARGTDDSCRKKGSGKKKKNHKHLTEATGRHALATGPTNKQSNNHAVQGG